MKEYYNQDYFNWQKKYGEFGGKANLWKFASFIKKNDTVVDFGCGGGYLLTNIDCQEKIGIEINSIARAQAEKNKIKCYSDINSVPDQCADVIISNSVLEHTDYPLQIIKDLRRILKKEGKIIFVVPQERKFVYRDHDVNQHLYTWSPMNLGNLFKAAGYKIVKVETLKSFWPPGYIILYRIFGARLFNIFCKLWAFFNRSIYQTRIIAINK